MATQKETDELSQLLLDSTGTSEEVSAPAGQQLPEESDSADVAVSQGETTAAVMACHNWFKG